MNKLFFGDNFDWLGKMDTEIVDLVYLDLPLNFHPAAIRVSAEVTPVGAV